MARVLRVLMCNAMWPLSGWDIKCTLKWTNGWINVGNHVNKCERARGKER